MAATNNNVETKEYTVVRLDRNNLADVMRLHKAVYGEAASTAHFPAKYDTAYTGAEYVGFIAYNHDQLPVAYYGVIPYFIQSGSQSMLAAQSADTMTHPGHRYKGMFATLSRLTFSLCRELGIRLIFGFPNQHSYHGAIYTLGWKMTEAMDCFLIPVHAIPLEALSRRSLFLQKLYKFYRRSILSWYTIPDKGLGNTVATGGFAGICRDEAYLSYKQFSRPRVIRAGKAKVWISNKPGLLIGDMEGVNGANFSDIIRKLKRLAKRLGVQQLQFHTSPGTRLHGLFSAHYTATSSYPVLFQDFGAAIASETIKFTFADIDIF